MGGPWEFQSTVPFRIVSKVVTVKPRRPDQHSVIWNASVPEHHFPRSMIGNGASFGFPITTNAAATLPAYLAMAWLSIESVSQTLYALALADIELRELLLDRERDFAYWFKMLRFANQADTIVKRLLQQNAPQAPLAAWNRARMSLGGPQQCTPITFLILQNDLLEVTMGQCVGRIVVDVEQSFLCHALVIHLCPKSVKNRPFYTCFEFIGVEFDKKTRTVSHNARRRTCTRPCTETTTGSSVMLARSLLERRCKRRRDASHVVPLPAVREDANELLLRGARQC